MIRTDFISDAAQCLMTDTKKVTSYEFHPHAILNTDRCRKDFQCSVLQLSTILHPSWKSVPELLWPVKNIVRLLFSEFTPFRQGRGWFLRRHCGSLFQTPSLPNILMIPVINYNIGNIIGILSGRGNVKMFFFFLVYPTYDNTYD